MRISENNTITEEQELRSKDRGRLVVFIWGFIAGIIIVKTFYIQIVKHNYYDTLGRKQYVASVPINFDRGSIFFAHYGANPVPAAQLQSVYRIAIDPTQIKDSAVLFTTLSKLIPIDEVVFNEKASKKNDPYEEIASNVSSDIVTLLKKQNLKGVMYYKDNKRSYPQEDVGAKVIGFVGNDGKQVRGQYGIERYYDDVLTRNSNDTTINFFAELFTDIQKTVVSNADKEEGDVFLTIDAEAQRVLHQTLLETKTTWNSDIIGGIIMDPQTGAIIAMDSLPSFDPNSYQDIRDSTLFINQNVSGVYEMGSIIKPITMASAIDAKAINEASTTYNDKGSRDLNGYKVSNYDGKARGPHTSMQMI